MPTEAERLLEMLNAKDRELDAAREHIEQLETTLAGSLDGWWQPTKPVDFPGLPVPRLELVYEPLRRGWQDYKVTYRLVYRHFEGMLIGLPIGWTKVGSGLDARPGPDDLPFRQGPQSAHDTAHLGLPCFRVVPGEDPVRVDFSRYEHALLKGAEHRRP